MSWAEFYTCCWIFCEDVGIDISIVWNKDLRLSFLLLFGVCIMNKVIMVLLLEFRSVVVTNESVILLRRLVWALTNGWTVDRIMLEGGLSWINKHCLVFRFPVQYSNIWCSWWYLCWRVTKWHLGTATSGFVISIIFFRDRYHHDLCIKAYLILSSVLGHSGYLLVVLVVLAISYCCGLDGGEFLNECNNLGL